MPDPITSVRSPHTAPEPKLNCMSFTPRQELLQHLFGSVGDIPGLRVAGDCRAREMVGPPTFNQQLDRRGRSALVGAVIFLGHWSLLRRRRIERKHRASMLNKCPPLVSRRLLEAQNFDGHDRDGLITEYALICLKLARHIVVLHHLTQP